MFFFSQMLTGVRPAFRARSLEQRAGDSREGRTRGSVLWGRMGGKAKPTKHTAKELAKKVCRSYPAPFSSNLHCVSRFAVLAGAQTPLVPMQDLTEWNGSGL